MIERVAMTTVERRFGLPVGEGLAVALTVQVTTPGECCVSIASSLPFSYEPTLVEEVAFRLDDRLYDGIYEGLARLEGPLPPEHLKVAVLGMASTPPLGVVFAEVDWLLVRQVGDWLAELAAETVVAAWEEYQRAELAGGGLIAARTVPLD